MVKSIFIQFLLLLGSLQFLYAQQNGASFWSDIPEHSLNSGSLERVIKPVKYRTISIDIPTLSATLALAGQGSNTVQISIPTPDGNTERFEVKETSVMDPALQAQYPDIRCYTGRGVDNPGATIKCDLTPWGFHAMTFSPGAGSVFIDPYFHGDPGTGIVYYKKDFRRRKNEVMTCLTVGSSADDLEEITPGIPAPPKDAPEAGDCQLRKYRLALACTGEYAAFHGGTKPLVLAAYNTTMNRINGVYEKDFAVTMQLIAKTDTLIFFNSATDPYTNDDGGAMLDENQATVTARIGAANYDIGHVFSTGGGGIAGLGVVCNNTAKANGVTGSGAPIGDPFDIDYVAHEMGHQFGANHSFNNSCGDNINGSTAMEPGSGSTIMSYAGICDPNVQDHSDDYFHAINIQEIIAYTNTGTGNGCPVKTVTGNNAPTVNNVPNYTIPKSTPFALTAVGNDVDGDALTYCWEQMDPEVATMPPVSTSATGPLFRSVSPVASPTRYFPALADLVANVNSQWEELPGVARSMKFRVVVRDNHPAAGCTAEDNVTLTVAGTAGPFTVTAPNTNVTWYALENKTITWNVNNTNMAPVSCANVKISLSYDGGFTYPVVLAESVPNNGSAVITVPYDMTSNTCRIKVSAVGNVFFDISNVNFSIQGSQVPTYVLSTAADVLEVCAGTTASYTVKAIGLTGFTSPVNLSVTGAPAGAQVSLSSSPVTPTSQVTLNISGLTPAMAGNYTINMTGVSGSITRVLPLQLSVLPGIPTATATGVNPANGATGVSVYPTLSWGAVQYADHYTVEIAPDPSFSQQVITLETDTFTVSTPALVYGKPYYWRIKAKNMCGDGSFSNFYAFQTGGELCNQTYQSTNVPVGIDVGAGTTNVSSVLTVPVNKIVSDADVSVNIAHTWVGDIDASLVAPDGTAISLFNRPGVPASADGCSNDNIIVTFNDAATDDAVVLEGTCNAGPAIAGAFKPIGLLSTLNGKNAQGTWTLKVNDNFPGEDSGSINAWSMSFCFTGNIAPAQVLANNTLTVNSAATGTISTALLSSAVSGNASSVVYTVTSNVANGTLQLNGVTIGLGAVFTQADVNAGLVKYVHNGNTAVADQFRFDVLDQNSLGWLSNQVFNIVIVQNTLNATATVTSAILCSGTANGVITVTASGGVAPLQYRLNNGNNQSSNVFMNLGAGSYTVVVTDALGFTKTAGTLTLTAPSAITVNTSVAFDDLTVTANGGTGVLEYSIDGLNFNTSGIFENLSDGVYTVTVRDANGCTATAQVAVSVSALLGTAVQTSNINCYGELTGEITASVAGGFSPYTYSLNGVDFQNSNVFGGLAAGSYTVTIRDANGTTTTTSNITIGQPALLTATASVSLNLITVTASGGTAGYSYGIGGAQQGSNVLTVLANGSYVILVTDNHGCTTSVTATVNIPTLAITDIVSENVTPCDGVVGTMTVVATGGIPPYQYRLNGGQWQSSASFQNVQPGNLNFEVLDAINATVSSNVVIVAPIPVSASVSVVANSATVTAAGGNGNYTFTLDNGTPQTTGVFNGLAAGNYSVVVTDGNGCTAEASFIITYQPMSVTYLVTNVSCFGSSDGSAVISVSGGEAPYSYTGSVSNLPAGSYTVTITDAVNFSTTVSFTVTQPAPVAATVTQNGAGTVTINATGGTTPYLYSIDNGATFQSTNIFVGVPDGNYTVVVKDANGCSFSVSFEATGSVEPSTAWGARISPNPTSGLFHLSVGAAPVDTLHAAIHDVTGRLLQTFTFECAGGLFQTNFDLTSQPSGVYYLQLTFGSNTGVVKVIKS